MGTCMSSDVARTRRAQSMTTSELRDQVEKVLSVPRAKRKDPFEAGWYEKIQRVGKGAYTEVYLCRDLRPKNKNKTKDIIKVFDMVYFDNDDILQLQREILIQKGLSSKPYFPSVIDIFVSENKERVFLVEERAMGGDLFEYICGLDRIPEDGCRALFKCLLEAIAAMHDMGITHRDLKPENIFLTKLDDPSSIQVGDFGQAHSNNKKLAGVAPWSRKRMSSFVGTHEYMAPEMVVNQVDDSNTQSYSMLVDEWALGCIFYMCLTGTQPYGIDDEGKKKPVSLIFEEIMSSSENKLTFPPEFKLNDNEKDLVKLLLEPNVERRISAKEALDLIFFKEKEINTPGWSKKAIMQRKNSLDISAMKSAEKRRKSITGMRKNSISRKNSGLGSGSQKKFARTGSITEFSRVDMGLKDLDTGEYHQLKITDDHEHTKV